MPKSQIRFAFALALAAICLAGSIASAQTSRAQLDAAIGALSVFASPLTRWEDIATNSGPDGVDYRDFVRTADTALRNSGFATYDNPRWIEGQGRAFLDNPSSIANASIPELRALLGGISRSEKFVAGRMGTAIINGVYLQTHLRLVQLRGN